MAGNSQLAAAAAVSSRRCSHDKDLHKLDHR